MGFILRQCRIRVKKGEGVICATLPRLFGHARMPFPFYLETPYFKP